MDDIQMFTEGDCHILAKYLSERTGWPMCAFSCKGDTRVLDLHAFVRRPDGKILDVQGLATEHDFRKRWSERAPIVEATWNDFVDWNHMGWFDGSHERAQELANELLAMYGAMR